MRLKNCKIKEKETKRQQKDNKKWVILRYMILKNYQKDKRQIFLGF